MELWGFEREIFFTDSGTGRFLEIKPKGSGGGGGGGNKIVALDPPPPVKLSEVKGQAKPGESAAVVIIKVPQKKGKHYDPAKVFTIPAFFRNKGGAGIDTQEEYEDVMADVEDSPYYKQYVSGYEPNSQFAPGEVYIQSYTDESQTQESGEVSLKAYNSLPEAPADPAVGGDMGIFKPIDYKAKMRELEKKEATIEEIMEIIGAILAAGDLDALVEFLNMRAVKERLDATELATVVIEAMGKHDVADEKTRDKMYNIMKKEKPTAQDRADFQKLEGMIKTNEAFRQSLETGLRGALDSATESAKDVREFQNRIRQINDPTSGQ